MHVLAVFSQTQKKNNNGFEKLLFLSKMKRVTVIFVSESRHVVALKHEPPLTWLPGKYVNFA